MCQSMFFAIHIIIVIMSMFIFRVPMVMSMLMSNDMSMSNSIMSMNYYMAVFMRMMLNHCIINNKCGTYQHKYKPDKIYNRKLFSIYNKCQKCPNKWSCRIICRRLCRALISLCSNIHKDTQSICRKSKYHRIHKILE